MCIRSSKGNSESLLFSNVNICIFLMAYLVLSLFLFNTIRDTNDTAREGSYNSVTQI